MKYAVIRLQGQQFRVSEGDEILVGKLKDPKKVEPEVLLVVDEAKVKIGKPVIKDAKVAIKVLSELEKGEKIEIYKFKAKSRYKRHTGFRPKYSRLQIGKIS
jgi:large subunit ribosomal protein L21